MSVLTANLGYVTMECAKSRWRNHVKTMSTVSRVDVMMSVCSLSKKAIRVMKQPTACQVFVPMRSVSLRALATMIATSV